MAEKKANRHPSITNGYHIPIDEDNLTHFPDQGHVAVVLNEKHSGYRVYQKEIPRHLKGRKHKEQPITWLNNFGLKEKSKKNYAAAVPEYTVLLDHIEGVEYVYFDGNEIRPLNASRHEEDHSKVKVKLEIGDPPIGWAKTINF